jgi:ABC-2 type transport system ATP-binding protein
MSVIINSLTKHYGSQVAVNQLSLDIPKGCIYGFLGPNGAGKSTTMKMIAGFLIPTAGFVEVCGQRVDQFPLQTKKNIGYLPENNPVYKDQYILEYLTSVARIYKMNNPIKRAKDVIEITGLTPEKNKKIGTLSKGYKQRVGIAQAIIHQPEVLILDEPTSGLDPNQLVEIRSLIKTLGQEKTIIFSTHIMQEVEAVCDTAVIIDKGRLITHQKLATIEHHYFIQFENPIDEGHLLKLKGVTQIQKERQNAYSIRCPKNEDIRKELFYLAVQQNNPILELKSAEISLEKVFQNLTGQKK